MKRLEVPPRGGVKNVCWSRGQGIASKDGHMGEAIV